MERRLKGCDVINNGIQVGHSIKYRPNPKPPERLAAVVDPGGRWYVSRGCLDNEGKLRIMGTLDIIVHWYCPSTGEHSERWKKEWTPEEFRK